MAYLAIIGVGRGGIHIVNEIVRKGMENEDVSCMVCDTDEVILQKSPVKNKFLLNVKTDNKQFLTENSREEFIKEIDGIKIVIFIAGMGGITGRDLLPELVSCCRTLNIKVCCMVTSPFSFEGEVKIKIAVDSLNNLRQFADNVIVIPNDIIQENDTNLNPGNAYQKSDLILAELCHEFCFIMTEPSYVSFDLEDIFGILKNSATTIIATGYSSGEKRILAAFENAIQSPFFKSYKIREVDRIVCSLQCSQQHQITMNEVEYIHSIMRSKLKKSSDFVWLVYLNDALNEEVKVTLFISIDK